MTSYYQVHANLTRQFGRAKDHRCACGERAADWAYLHTAGDKEKRNSKGSPYSEDPGDYAPMCVHCHRLLDRDSYRANRRRWGECAGRLTAERIKSDPAYAERITLNLGEHLDRMKNDEDYRARYKGYMRRTNLKRYRCDDCGYENNAGNMGWHRKKTGHQNRSEVMSDVQ